MALPVKPAGVPSEFLTEALAAERLMSPPAESMSCLVRDSKAVPGVIVLGIEQGKASAAGSVD